jgi:hypothetical protein
LHVHGKKITPFLVIQIAQQTVIKIFLKKALPKSDLALMIISNGWRFVSQLIGIEFQQT